MEKGFVAFVVLKSDMPLEGRGSAGRGAMNEEFVGCIRSLSNIEVTSYLVSGFKADADIMLRFVGSSPEEVQEGIAKIMRTGLGRRLAITQTFVGMVREPKYAKHDKQSQHINSEQHGKYVAVYPFTKTPEWYMLDSEKRGELMMEHIRAGKAFPSVKQVLLYAYGIDDYEFILQYETDDLVEYQDAVIALRSVRARPYTKSDTPVFFGVYYPAEQIVELMA